MVWIVVGDAVSDDIIGNVKRSSNGSSASHVGNNRLASEEASDREARGAEAKAGFGAFFVKFGAVDTECGRAGGAVSQSISVADKARELREVSIVLVKDNDIWIHFEKGGLRGGVFFGRHGIKRSWQEVGHGGDINRETIEDVVFKRLRWSGDDDIGRASFPGFGEKLVQDGGLNGRIGSKHGDMLTGSAKNFVDEVGDDAFARGASNANEFHITDRVAIITRQELGVRALKLRLEGRFLFRFGFIRGGLRIIHHEAIITQKTL